jgi:hypothetical protein
VALPQPGGVGRDNSPPASDEAVGTRSPGRADPDCLGIGLLGGWLTVATGGIAAAFLGHAIAQGVRPEFKTMLATAETKVKDEYKKSGNTPPPGYGIKFIGGYRREISPHGAGVAIDIDGGDNPYIMHEGEQLAAITDPSKQTALSKELGGCHVRVCSQQPD